MIQLLELFFTFNRCKVQISFPLLVRRGLKFAYRSIFGSFRFSSSLTSYFFRVQHLVFGFQQLAIDSCMYINVFLPSTRKRLIYDSLVQYVKLIDQYMCYILITLLAIQYFFLVHLFLRLYSLQQKHKCKTNLL